MTEKEWQSTVVDLARVYGWAVFHQFDSRRSAPGWPDLVLLRPPEIVFAELKTDAGKVRPEQTVTLSSLESCGLECYIWRPRDWDQVSARLRPTGRRS